jgi:hypothetical protein
MTGYTLAQAKRDHQIGYLTAYAFERSPLSRCWMVALGSGNARGWLTDARSNTPREFKSLDSAVSAIEQIGFEVNAVRP